MPRLFGDAEDAGAARLLSKILDEEN